MSLFSQILEKLGLRRGQDDDQPAAARPASAPAAASRPTPTPAATPPRSATPPSSSRPATTPPKATSSRPAVSGPAPVKQAPAAGPAGPKAISEVDVVKQLDEKAKGTGLNWKNSIVDLLKLLDIDSSREARIELAKELGAPADVMSDSARMNVWLHKTVMKKIAENGGNIPQDLLD